MFKLLIPLILSTILSTHAQQHAQQHTQQPLLNNVSKNMVYYADILIYDDMNTHMYHVNRLNSTNSSMECDLCNIAVNIIKHEINLSNVTIHYIEDIIDIICDIFNKRIICNEIISEINYIIDMILKGWSTKNICEDLHMCNNNFMNVNIFYMYITNNLTSI